MGQLLRQLWRQVVLLARTPVLLRVCCASSHLSPLLSSDSLLTAPVHCEPSLSLWQVSDIMPIASDACLLRIGTGRPRPNAPRVARAHALCEPRNNKLLFLVRAPLCTAGRAGRADFREGQHTLGVCRNRIRFCRVFDGRQRAVAAPSCNDRRVSDVLADRGRACDSWRE